MGETVTFLMFPHRIEMQNSSLRGGKIKKNFFLLTKCFYILTLRSPLVDTFFPLFLFFFFFGCFGVVPGLIGKVCNLGGKGSLFSSFRKNILLSKSDTQTPSLSSCGRGWGYRF